MTPRLTLTMTFVALLCACSRERVVKRHFASADGREIVTVAHGGQTNKVERVRQ